MQVIFSEIDGIRYIWVNSANLMIFGQKTHQIGVFYPKIAELMLFSPKSNKIMTLSKFRQFGDFLHKKLVLKIIRITQKWMIFKRYQNLLTKCEKNHDFHIIFCIF